MELKLMRKNEPVLNYKKTDKGFLEITKIYNPDIMPVIMKGEKNSQAFTEWFNKRCYPEKRIGRKEMIDRFGSEWLDCKNYLSLSDQYWVRDLRSGEKWSDLNFFENQYSTDIGDMAFKPWKINKKKISSYSPDLTTSGVLKKRWIQKENNVSYLVKAGNRGKQSHQEPLAEVLVSVLLEKLKIIPFVRYDLHVEGVEMCSICKNFINFSTELITLADLSRSVPRKHKDIYYHLLYTLEHFKIPYGKEYVDALLFVDKLTGNRDRHLGNMAVIRNVDTNTFVGPAPLYDSGDSYWDLDVMYGTKGGRTFKEVDEKIFKEIKKKVKLEVLLDKKTKLDYEKAIYEYPLMSDERKERMVEAIAQRNEKLCKEAAREI